MDSMLVKPNWMARMSTDSLSEELRCRHAELFYMGKLMCRISMAGAFPTQQAADDALATRLQQWVLEFESRDAMGVLSTAQ